MNQLKKLKRVLEIAYTENLDDYELLVKRLKKELPLFNGPKRIAAAVLKEYLGDISSLELPQEKLYQKIPVGLSCKGSFVSLYGFLQDLEKMDRFTMVQKMVMGKVESGQCQLDLNLLLFVREPRAIQS